MLRLLQSSKATQAVCGPLFLAAVAGMPISRPAVIVGGWRIAAFEAIEPPAIQVRGIHLYGLHRIVPICVICG